MSGRPFAAIDAMGTFQGLWYKSCLLYKTERDYSLHKITYRTKTGNRYLMPNGEMDEKFPD